MKRKIEVKDTGTGLMLNAVNWKHPLSYNEGRRFKETLRRLLNQSVLYDSFEVLLPEDGGAESVIIERKNAFELYAELRKMFNN